MMTQGPFIVRSTALSLSPCNRHFTLGVIPRAFRRHLWKEGRYLAQDVACIVHTET